MQYRKFGHTELLVSEIGFGAWAIGGGTMVGTTAIGWGKTDDEESIKAINAAIDKGINFFDTADIYGLGHSEELIGKTVGKNKAMIIATKVGNVSRDEKFTVDYSKKYILAACETSLRRLKRESIDYYQLHSARLEHLQQGECIEAMEYLRKEGKIRYWGLSLNTFDPAPDAEFLITNSRGNGFQLVLNIINQKSIGLIAQAHQRGYGVIARMPLQFGLLTGKFDKHVAFESNDHRKNRLVPEVIEASNKALLPVWELCSKYKCSKLQLALSFVLSYPGVSTVIPGIRKVEQAKQNTTGLFALHPDDRRLIEQMGKTDLLDLMKLIQQKG
jgi:aryl-alcohol dehydrogenase-like predicted oxidoreductase